MNKEHVVAKVANKINECAMHIKEVFTKDAYHVDVVKSNDTNCEGRFVQICNMKGTVGNAIKRATGLDISAILKLWTDDEDLRFKVESMKWIEPAVLSSSVILSASILTFPIPTPLQIVGWVNQQHFLERIRKETALFLTLDNMGK